MRKALVHSIPGSGTRFCTEFISRVLGYSRVDSPEKLVGAKAKNTFCHTHVWNRASAMLCKSDVQIIVPLRDPYLVYLTRRYRLLHPTDNPREKRETMARYWHWLIMDTALMSNIYVPVEAGLDKRWLLQSIADHLKAPIKDEEFFEKMIEEWPKVGTAGPRPERDKYERTGLIDGKALTFLDSAVEWYEDIVQSIDL